MNIDREILCLSFRGRCLVHQVGFRVGAASFVKVLPTFRQSLQLPFSGLMLWPEETAYVDLWKGVHGRVRSVCVYVYTHRCFHMSITFIMEMATAVFTTEKL
jgi:hypothetical protein